MLGTDSFGALADHLFLQNQPLCFDKNSFSGTLSILARQLCVNGIWAQDEKISP
jgi:hypothetical protein